MKKIFWTALILCLTMPLCVYAIDGSNFDADNDGDVDAEDLAGFAQYFGTLRYFKDFDGDLYSDGTTQYSTSRPIDYYLESELTSTDGDCDDNNFSINPGVQEICADGLDNDCDGVADEADCQTYNSPCPPEMVLIQPEGFAGFCIDRWEAHIIDHSPYNIPSQGIAASRPNVVPQGYISGIVAAQACEEAGKRLCWDDEWLRACQGASGWRYPYGEDYIQDTCNDFRSVHPIIELGLSWSDINNPLINQLSDTVDLTGTNPGCVTPEGVFDLVGNLNEWTLDPSGTFRGGYYVESYINGEGCLYRTTAHSTIHNDFSTGFRCCMEPQ